MPRTYSFRDRWWLPHHRDDVRDVLVDPQHYPAWWPQVVAVAKTGDDTARVLCRSRLPYTLDFTMHAVTRDLPVLEVALSGHLRGHVRWWLTAYAGGTRLDLAQQVTVHGLPALAPRGLARWNHRRMLAGGRTGLTELLARSPGRSG